VIGGENPCCPWRARRFRTIKAGRRKLSRKKNGKGLPPPGELPGHFSVSVAAASTERSMSLKT
jgi:hypothetical protein